MQERFIKSILRHPLKSDCLDIDHYPFDMSQLSYFLILSNRRLSFWVLLECRGVRRTNLLIIYILCFEPYFIFMITESLSPFLLEKMLWVTKHTMESLMI